MYNQNFKATSFLLALGKKVIVRYLGINPIKYMHDLYEKKQQNSDERNPRITE